MTDSTSPKDPESPTDALPFAAPCKDLQADAPFRWIKLGWQDLRRAPAQSLGYGAILVALSYLLAFLAVTFGNYVVLLALLSGFVFVGPLLAMAFYDISAEHTLMVGDRRAQPTWIAGQCCLRRWARRCRRRRYRT